MNHLVRFLGTESLYWDSVSSDFLQNCCRDGDTLPLRRTAFQRNMRLMEVLIEDILVRVIVFRLQSQGFPPPPLRLPPIHIIFEAV